MKKNSWNPNQTRPLSSCTPSGSVNSQRRQLFVPMNREVCLVLCSSSSMYIWCGHQARDHQRSGWWSRADFIQISRTKKGLSIILRCRWILPALQLASPSRWPESVPYSKKAGRHAPQDANATSLPRDSIQKCSVACFTENWKALTGIQDKDPSAWWLMQGARTD